MDLPSPVEALSAREAPAGEPRPVPSFDDTYEENFSFVWRSVRRLGVPASIVADAVQDVFVVVHRRLPDFEARASVRTWLYAIVIRVVRDYRRTYRRKELPVLRAGETADPDEQASRDQGPHELVVRSEAARTLHELLDGLDEDKREVFVLAELEQLSVPEIAEAVGINLNTAYSRLRAARQDFEQAVARRRARDAWRPT